MENINQNPLMGYFRKPEIYITLPSKGRYYEDGALDMPANEEIGIFPMTAKDELIFKTPDALLNGASNVEVIKSCVPSINDPWKIPSLDMDIIMIGIRMATYGEDMELTITCPECKNQNTFVMNLMNLIGDANNWSFNDTLVYNDLTITFRPLTYKELNGESLRQFEESKILKIINDDTIDDEQKQALFQDSFLKLTGLTVDLIGKMIKTIKTPIAETSDRKHIAEFIHNADRKTFTAIQDHLNEQKNANSFSDFKTKCPGNIGEENHVECGHEISTPVIFNNSDFFE